MSDRKRVELYVRLGSNRDEGERELSFQIPEGLSQKDLLDHGFAVDGNSALMGITSYEDPDGGRTVSMAAALHEVQEDVMRWLTAKGYDVVFS